MDFFTILLPLSPKISEETPKYTPNNTLAPICIHISETVASNALNFIIVRTINVNIPPIVRSRRVIQYSLEH